MNPRDMLKNVEQRLREINQERELLLRLRDLYGGSDAQQSFALSAAKVIGTATATAEGTVTGKLKTSDAVVAVVKRHPEGITQADLIKEGLEIVDTKSTDIKGNLRWYANAEARKKDQIVRRDDGLYYPVGGDV